MSAHAPLHNSRILSLSHLKWKNFNYSCLFSFFSLPSFWSIGECMISLPRCNYYKTRWLYTRPSFGRLVWGWKCYVLSAPKIGDGWIFRAYYKHLQWRKTNWAGNLIRILLCCCIITQYCYCSSKILMICLQWKTDKTVGSIFSKSVNLHL